MRTLARSLGDYSIKCTGTDRQVAAYLMKKLEQFYEPTLSDESSSSTQISTKHAVTVTGLQLKKMEDGKKLWVLNHLVHIDDEGELVDPKDSSMVWLGQFFLSDSERAGLPASQYLINHFASIATPELEASALAQLLDALQVCYGHNFPACLLTIGAYVLCIHYEQIMDLAEQVPAAVAFGDFCHGKSRACRAALLTLGVQHANYVSRISDMQSLRRSATTTLLELSLMILQMQLSFLTRYWCILSVGRQSHARLFTNPAQPSS